MSKQDAFDSNTVRLAKKKTSLQKTSECLVCRNGSEVSSFPYEKKKDSNGWIQGAATWFNFPLDGRENEE